MFSKSSCSVVTNASVSADINDSSNVCFLTEEQVLVEAKAEEKVNSLFLGSRVKRLLSVTGFRFLRKMSKIRHREAVM